MDVINWLAIPLFKRDFYMFSAKRWRQHLGNAPEKLINLCSYLFMACFSGEKTLF